MKRIEGAITSWLFEAHSALKKWLTGVVILGILGISLLGLFRYAVEVKDEIDSLAFANADSQQWALAQLEVEFDRMMLALMEARADDAESLDEIARTFDIFFSRVGTVFSGDGFREVADSLRITEEIATLRGFLDGTAALIDAGGLAGALPALKQEARTLAPDVRTISLDGVRVFSERAMIQRERVYNALVRLAALTTALLSALVGGLAVMWFLLGYGMRQTWSLRAAKLRLEAVFGTSLEAIIVADDALRIIEFNGAAETIFGLSRDEALGRPFFDLIVMGDAEERHRATLENCCGNREARMLELGLVEMTARRSDGSEFPAELSMSSTRIARGTIFVTYLRDITDRVAAQTELISARDKAMAGERAKAAFMAVMSHEMRTPLNGLLGSLDILRDTDLDARQRSFVQAMEQAGQILLQHVNNVLDVERLDAGKLSFSRVAYRPDALVAQIVEAQRLSAAARGNRMETVTDGASAPVLGDPMRIRQVLLNLVGNAAKFTENGIIRIGIGYDAGAGEIEFRVMDTGIGIAPEHVEKVFEDFVTIDPDLSREHAGSGLGLGIARRLVQGMGGRMDLDSTPGVGSVFRVRLPAPPASAADALPAETPAARAAQPDPVAALSPMRALVVEDNNVNRKVLCEMLRRAGHAATEARNGLEAVEMAMHHPFDVILMDLNMPVMDGFKAAERILSRPGPNQATPVIAVTANVMHGVEQKLRRAGFTDMMSKPISRQRLAQALGQAVHVPGPDGDEELDLLDPAVLEDLELAIGADNTAEVCRTFVADSEIRLRMMLESLRGQDMTGYANEAHKFAGASALVGAKRLHAVLKRHEEAATLGDAALIRDGLDGVRDLRDETVGALDDWADLGTDPEPTLACAGARGDI